MVAAALAVARLKRLFASVMLYSIYSALSAILFVLLDAVDVALTEAAVGTCISTILMLSALSLTGTRVEISEHQHPILALCVVVVVGVALIYGISDMPIYTDPNAPANLHVAPTYLSVALSETGSPNVVTAVLASYRGYDTLGEVVVIFTAGIGVVALLVQRRKNNQQDQ